MDNSAPSYSAAAYTKLGFDPIPLIRGSKRPLRKGWQIQPPEVMWRVAPIDANLGLRGGGQVNAAFIDCDDKKVPGTFSNAQMWLEGLGFVSGDYPLVKTASGSGRHIYFSLDGSIEGNSYALSQEFGAGELRFGSGAYVVAPPSNVDCQEYQLLDGDYQNLPTIAVCRLFDI